MGAGRGGAAAHGRAHAGGAAGEQAQSVEVQARDQVGLELREGEGTICHTERGA